ncbi:hypothetical protein P4H66_00935 [Paenibacillus dokdonensis]|uniref:Uncharacterized protein n=1 Tax=Paenibacillus dokdonensis TaxID=2567944 RepID=A0ABU6GJM6_9BACL|nr:hypothetical protein [Paenibacillus dokdonensis]MEC0238436.1 hypothetical protein [Paenibacillus dokdonensis]
MLRTPSGEANIELVKFHTPTDENGIQQPLANTLGIRHIAFAGRSIGNQRERNKEWKLHLRPYIQEQN